MKKIFILISSIFIIGCAVKKSTVDTAASLQSSSSHVKYVRSDTFSQRNINSSSHIFITEKITEKDTLGRIIRCVDRVYNISDKKQDVKKDTILHASFSQMENAEKSTSELHSQTKSTPKYSFWIVIIVCGGGVAALIFYAVKKKLFLF